MKVSFALLAALLLSKAALAAEFSFVALGDTAYNGEADYAVYRRLIATINAEQPAFTIHVGDIWGAGNCHDWHIERIAGFFEAYEQPLIYTPGDNEWTDCDHRAMGGYEASERLDALREAFFADGESLGAQPMPLVRQADVSAFDRYVENVRWARDNVLFLTLNVPGSHNNYVYDDAHALTEAVERTRANVAWLRDGFRIAREDGAAAVVVALHAEMFMNGDLPLSSYNGALSGPYGPIIRELRLGADRFGGPVLLVHGDSHEFVVDRPLIESQGESEPPLHANVVRLEVFGAPEIKAVKVDVDTDAPWPFSFAPLYPKPE